MHRDVPTTQWGFGGFDAIWRLATRPLNDAFSEAGAILFLIPLTLSIAIWNRFPIIFYDTGAYLMEGVGRVFLAERSPVYSLFLDYGGAQLSLWLIALIQAAATSLVIVETARSVAPKFSLGGILVLVLALTILTGLPWYVGQIEPDCFAALVVLSLFLLAFHGDTLAGWRRRILFAIAVFAMAVHPSHLLLGLGLVLLLAGLSVLKRMFRSPALLRPALSCVLAVVLVAAANFELVGAVFISRSGPAFVFARLLQDRIVMRLLDERCPEAGYRLCEYKDFLPRTANQWLWGRGSPFLKLGRFNGTSAESSRIILDTVKRYPLMQLRTAIADSATQFVTFTTGDQIEAQQWVLERPLSQFIPGQIPAYLAARQQKGEFDFRPVNRIHVPFAWLSILALVATFAFLMWRGRREQAILPGLVLASLIGNATICGTLSNPHDRYQSRLIWLAPFALALIAGDRTIFALRGLGESGT